MGVRHIVQRDESWAPFERDFSRLERSETVSVAPASTIRLAGAKLRSKTCFMRPHGVKGHPSPRFRLGCSCVALAMVKRLMHGLAIGLFGGMRSYRCSRLEVLPERTCPQGLTIGLEARTPDIGALDPVRGRSGGMPSILSTSSVLCFVTYALFQPSVGDDWDASGPRVRVRFVTRFRFPCACCEPATSCDAQESLQGSNGGTLEIGINKWRWVVISLQPHCLGAPDTSGRLRCRTPDRHDPGANTS